VLAVSLGNGDKSTDTSGHNGALALDDSDGGNGISGIDRGGDAASYWHLQQWYCAAAMMEVLAWVAAIIELVPMMVCTGISGIDTNKGGSRSATDNGGWGSEY